MNRIIRFACNDGSSEQTNKQTNKHTNKQTKKKYYYSGMKLLKFSKPL